jgi:hypothetical protein
MASQNKVDKNAQIFNHVYKIDKTKKYISKRAFVHIIILISKVLIVAPWYFLGQLFFNSMVMPTLLINLHIQNFMKVPSIS